MWSSELRRKHLFVVLITLFSSVAAVENHASGDLAGTVLINDPAARDAAPLPTPGSLIGFELAEIPTPANR